MLILPHQKKIFFIGLSLFVTVFSLLLFFVGGNGLSGDHLKTSIFDGLAQQHESPPATLHETESGLALDSNGGIIDGSPVFFDMFSFKSEDIMPGDIFSLVAADEVSTLAKGLLDALSKGTVQPLTGPYHVIDGMGRTRVVLITIQPVEKKKKVEKGENGVRGTSTLIFFKDISGSFDKDADGVKNGPAKKSIKNMPDGKDQKNRIIVEKTG